MTDSAGSASRPPIFGAWTWRRALLSSDLPGTTKHVLLTLSCHIPEIGGAAWPSIATLAAETSLTEATVKKHLRAGLEAGWIARQKRYTETGRQTSNAYALAAPSGGGGHLTAPTQGNDPHGGASKHPPQISSEEKLRDIAREENGDLFGESSAEPERNGVPYDRLWDVVVEVLFDGTTARSLTDTRRKKLRALYEEQCADRADPVAFFRQICRAVRADEWWGARPGTWLPEKAFRNAERREQFAVAAAEGRIEPKGEAPDWLSGLEEEGGWGN